MSAGVFKDQLKTKNKRGGKIKRKETKIKT
jgi:hypothetical protein